MLFRKVMEELGHDVLVVGSDYLHIEKTKRTTTDPKLVLIPTIPYEKNLSLKRIRSHLDFSRKAFRFLKDKECNLLYIVVPSNSQASIARKYKKLHPDTKVVIDVIDLWPESFPSRNSERFPFTIWAGSRNKNLKYADTVITECDLYHDFIGGYVRNGAKPETVYWAHDEEPSSFAGFTEPESDKWVLGYLGSVNNIIDIDGIKEVITRFKATRPVTVRIVGAGEKMEEFEAALKSAGAEVINYGKVTDFDKKQEIFAPCHFGINIMKPTVHVGMSMKSVDYMEMGLPVLNGIPGDMHDIVDEHNVGRNTDEYDFTGYDTEMKRNARRFYEENCSYDSYGRRIREVLGL